MDFFDVHDAIHLGSTAVGLLIAVTILKRDMKWLIEAFTKHEKLDDQRFEKVDEDIRELRRDMR